MAPGTMRSSAKPESRSPAGRSDGAVRTGRRAPIAAAVQRSLGVEPERRAGAARTSSPTYRSSRERSGSAGPLGTIRSAGLPKTTLGIAHDSTIARMSVRSLPRTKRDLRPVPRDAVAAPVVKWVGGKTKLLPELLARMPARYGRYYEPFVGGAALFFRVAPERAVIADSNPDLIGLYTSLVTDVAAVIRRLEVPLDIRLDKRITRRHSRCSCPVKHGLKIARSKYGAKVINLMYVSLCAFLR